MGLFLDWEWRYIQTDRMNIEAKNVSTIFLSWFSGEVRFVVVAITCEDFFYIL